MNKKIILVAFVFNVSAPAMAGDWTNEDTAWQAGYLVLHVIDWRQTRAASAQPERFRETNPILGDYPSQERVDRYFAATAILHTGISHVLPPKWRRTWQQVTIGVEIGAVANNYSIGVRGNF